VNPHPLPSLAGLSGRTFAPRLIRPGQMPQPSAHATAGVSTPGATQAVQVISSTWERDSHDLFDFEAQQLRTQSFTVTSTATCCRSGAEVQLLGGNAAAAAQQPGSEALLRLVQRDQSFWVDKATPCGSTRKLWLVVRELASKAHQLSESDVIKLGRFKFRVRQLVGTDQANTQPELRLDGVGTVCCPSFDADLSQNLCRICLLEGSGPDDPLIAPCECRGSIEYVHLGCLRYWIKGRLSLSDSTGGTYFYRPLGCELCKATYPAYIRTSQGETESLVEVPRTQPPFVVLENMVRDSQQHATRGLHVLSLAGEKALKLGRGHESDVRIADVSISRCHAVIRYSNGQFLLEDNNSKFGTLVAMKKPRRLEPGNPLSIQMDRTLLSLSLLPDANNPHSAANGSQRPVPSSGNPVRDERTLRLHFLSQGNREDVSTHDPRGDLPTAREAV